MKKALWLAYFVLLAGFSLCSACDQPKDTAARWATSLGNAAKKKTDYVERVKARLAQIEKSERDLNRTAQQWESKTKAQFEELLGQLVEKRVYAKEKVERLESATQATMSDAKSALESAMQGVDQAFERVSSYCH